MSQVDSNPNRLRHYILATAGHIDHGKSTLVKRLTRRETDRLPEEKKRGITIDLGFTDWQCPCPVDPNTAFAVGVIDVPGHEDFVKNMVAGIGAIDLALIVVAADDGWMPQTEEHLQILEYLGVSSAVIALNKIDIAELDEAFLIEVVREEVAGSAFAQAPIVTVSAMTGQGIPELRDAIAKVLRTLPEAEDVGKARLSVDRAFSLKGIGTVVTGTLMDGALHRDQEVVIHPSGRRARIRSLQNHNCEAEVAHPGTRTALNLANTPIRGKLASRTEGVARGDTIALPGMGEASEILDAVVERSDRLAGRDLAASRPLKHNHRVRFHLGASHIPARILLLAGSQIAAGHSAVARLLLETPVFARVGDRFVIRDWAEASTLAGGTVLDADSRDRRLRQEGQRRFLQTRVAGPLTARTLLRSKIERDRFVPRHLALLKSRVSQSKLESEIGALRRQGLVVECGPYLVETSWWRRMQDWAAGEVDSEHATRPHGIGLSLRDLRSRWVHEIGVNALFESLLHSLEAQGFTVRGEYVFRSDHKPALSGQLIPVANRIRSELGRTVLDPPSKKALAPDANSKDALQFLMDTGEVVALGPELVLLASGFKMAREAVLEALAGSPGKTVSEIRQTLGVSRRITVPLLEFLDASGITVREGDRRKLKRARDRPA